ncbi:MAG: hypothetical protein EAZ76_02775 [Nostocales cyanobacterium]|nr:MAG: hypothetical protein EAZ87_02750 [Nostocales cyanobacterium]TAF19788.1 MAG: hypothetical protein EAZ76_02775 [Nostocales cyanobacterium]
MRVWLACFFVLFALAEFFDWIKDLSLPLPIYILGGAFLAVASNYDKIVGSYFTNASNVTAEILSEIPNLNPSTPVTQIAVNSVTVSKLNSAEEIPQLPQE